MKLPSPRNFLYNYTQKVKKLIINYLTTNKLLKKLCFKHELKPKTTYVFKAAEKNIK